MASWSTNVTRLTGRLTAIQIDQAGVSEATNRSAPDGADGTSRPRSPDVQASVQLASAELSRLTARLPAWARRRVGPMLAEWVDALVSDAPHLVEANAAAVRWLWWRCRGQPAWKKSGSARNRFISRANGRSKKRSALAARPRGSVNGSQHQTLVLWPRHNLQTSSCQRSSLVTSSTHGGEIRPVPIRHRHPQPDYDTRAALGGTQVNMPHWNDLTGKPPAAFRFGTARAGEAGR